MAMSWKLDLLLRLVSRDDLARMLLAEHKKRVSWADIEDVSGITKLSTDPYGNHVIRRILEHGNVEQKRTIVNEVCAHVHELGKDQHGSKVVETCFEAANTGEHAAFLKVERQCLMRAVLGPAPKDRSQFAQLINDRFGKHVGKSVVLYSRPEEMNVLRRLMASSPGNKAAITSLLEMLEQPQQAQQSVYRDKRGGDPSEKEVQHEPEDSEGARSQSVDPATNGNSMNKFTHLDCSISFTQQI
ncbi:APUM5 [Symbiodinium natans]|uniref:APUM5 protein n=1 Tax=Symbiodinium natans TaxID=878477 RepID=A0A812JA44_9DINO|nr:APUM5 [Symbiodinium natans]